MTDPSILDQRDDGTGKSMLKDRWWPLPGVLAVVGTVVLVGIAQGWGTSQVVLPPSVQIGAPAVPVKATTTTTAAPVPPRDGIVVAAARPVLGQSTGASSVGEGSAPAPAAAPSASPDPTADTGEAANQGASSIAPVPTTLPPPTTVPPSTTTSRPGTTTTTDDGSGGGIDH